jgi:hypothetical protein
MTEFTPSSASKVARRDIEQGRPGRALGVLNRAQVGNDYATPDTMMYSSEPGSDTLYYSCDVLLGTLDTEDADVLIAAPALQDEVRELVGSSIESMRQRHDKYLASKGLMRAIRMRQAATLHDQIERGEHFLEVSSND